MARKTRSSPRVPGAPAPGSLEHFQREVLACTRELNRRIPVLGRTYSAAVLVVALVLQVEMALKAALSAEQITKREAHALIGRLSQAVAAG